MQKIPHKYFIICFVLAHCFVSIAFSFSCQNLEWNHIFYFLLIYSSGENVDLIIYFIHKEIALFKITIDWFPQIEFYLHIVSFSGKLCWAVNKFSMKCHITYNHKILIIIRRMRISGTIHFQVNWIIGKSINRFSAQYVCKYGTKIISYICSMLLQCVSIVQVCSFWMLILV